MTKRSLAAKLLASALCLSIPLSCSAAEMQTAVPRLVAPAAITVTMAPGQVYLTPAQLQGALDVHFPAGFTPESALRSLSSAKTPDAAATQALISAIAAPSSARGAAVAAAAAASTPEVQARLAAVQSAMRTAAGDNADFAKALGKLRSSAETPATAGAAARVAGVIKRAAALFTLNQPDLISVPGGPGSRIPPMGGVGLMPANFGSGKEPRKDAPKPAVPVSKRVTALQELVKSDPAAALAEAAAILNAGEGMDPRLEVRVAAIRALGQLQMSSAAPVLTAAAGETRGWYERREAARQLGLRADAVQGEARAAAIAALEGAAQARNASLRLMAGWALERYGVDAAPLMEKGEKLANMLFADGQVQVVRLNQLRPDQKPPKKSRFGAITKIMLGFTALWLGLTLMTSHPQHSNSTPADPPAITQVQKGAAGSGPAVVTEAPKPTQEQSLDQIAKDTKRTADAMEQLAKNTAPKQGSGIGGMLMNILLWVGVMFGISWVIRKMQSGGAGAFKGQMSQVKNKFERPDTTFNDVAGIDDARAEIEEIADYLHNPEKYRQLGARVPKGVLLDGPPGTGKTLLARALAGESGATFISVSGSDFIEMFVGVGASRVRELFNQAKANKPAIIFIDELDAVAKKRDGAKMSGGNDEREQTVNAILAEMSGFEDSSGVIVIAATNRADVLDPAITRPGRFDRKIHVGLPDVLGREAILQVHARKARLGADVDLQFIAKRTAGLSGAFLEGIINEAALLAARRGAAEISQADLNEGVDRATIGAKRNLFMAPETKRRVAFHESGHVIAGMLAGGVPPNKVTVIPHGSAALGFAEPGGQEDNYLYTQPELENRLVGILGGLAAEEIIFGNTSTGPDNDLEQATNIARRMVTRWGMSKNIGYAQSSTNEYGQPADSEQTKREIDLEVRRIVGAAKQKAIDALTARRDALDQMAGELLEKETLSGEDAQRIVGTTAK
jgi:cell division protease FtsH